MTTALSQRRPPLFSLSASIFRFLFFRFLVVFEERNLETEFRGASNCDQATHTHTKGGFAEPNKIDFVCVEGKAATAYSQEGEGRGAPILVVVVLPFPFSWSWQPEDPCATKQRSQVSRLLLDIVLKGHYR